MDIWIVFRYWLLNSALNIYVWTYIFLSLGSVLRSETAVSYALVISAVSCCCDTRCIDIEQISYIIPIDEKPYTVHLKQRFFLAHNFMAYLYKEGSMNSYSSNVQTQCYYQGHIEGYPSSVVTLSTCSGLRGILQFENVSYGIEPLEYTEEFQHLLYKLRNENNGLAVLTENNRGIEQNPRAYNFFISEKSESAVPDLIPLYLEVHIVVDKVLYDYLGSDSMIITNKIIEIIGLVNSMFAQFNVTVVLSSLELWSDKNKISTVGEADELLSRFSDWKKSYLTLRPHDIAYLFIQYSGVKTFSSCSLSDFENFVSKVGARCLQNKPQMQSSAQSTCGNRRVEGSEVCDCGTVEQCGPLTCCDPPTCTLKAGAQCHEGLCCKSCNISGRGVLCRPTAHSECDLPEYCDGVSPQCPPDITFHDGKLCKGEYFCYGGECQDLDARCQSLFGAGSRNAPFACYEEIQNHNDRFGNCGKKSGRYIFCGWRNLICGKLICTYPSTKPYYQENGAVIYAFVRNTICITLDLQVNDPDPMLVHSGAICDDGRLCVDRQCVEARFLQSQLHNCSAKCHGNGVCTSNLTCHCKSGYNPPDCQTRSRESSRLPGKQSLIMERAFRKAEKNWWFLGLYIGLPVLVIASIIAVVWNNLKKWLTKEEEALSSNSEGSTHTYASSSGSESSSQTDPVRFKSQESTQTHNITSNSFRRQWISPRVSLRNENSAFPPLTTAEGNNKWSVDQFACMSLFLSHL
ncbi:disintegrin and metalloproteinase domain-containing protein 32 isoform X8 [Equus caballus]|uniref:disintegrin and metalloproteinase domain-containing protein 32 isoform X8 n=1 Tax=Equus caballus TaxID=9796 RepID=UPI0038B39272